MRRLSKLLLVAALAATLGVVPAAADPAAHGGKPTPLTVAGTDKGKPMPAAASAQAAVPIIFVTPDNKTKVIGHQCRVLGTDGIGNEAVACSDLAVRGTTTQTEVWAVNQLLCQRSKVLFACQGISTTAEVAFSFMGDVAEVRRKNNYCGTFGGSACPSGRFQQGSYHWIWTTGYCYEMWGVAINNLVQTRSGIIVQGPNVASAHYVVCPA